MCRIGAVLVILSSALASAPAAAQSYCGGTAPPARILTYANGSVLVLPHWRGDFLQICNLNESWKSVEPAVCFSWMSAITNAISNNDSVQFFYYESGANFCATVPTYANSPAPGYIDIAQ